MLFTSIDINKKRLIDKSKTKCNLKKKTNLKNILVAN